MKFNRPDNRVSLPRSVGTSKIYTKGCSLGSGLSLHLFALKAALKDALLPGGHFSCVEFTP
jgi:hypothetical protein